MLHCFIQVYSLLIILYTYWFSCEPCWVGLAESASWRESSHRVSTYNIMSSQFSQPILRTNGTAWGFEILREPLANHLSPKMVLELRTMISRAPWMEQPMVFGLQPFGEPLKSRSNLVNMRSSKLDMQLGNAYCFANRYSQSYSPSLGNEQN